MHAVGETLWGCTFMVKENDASLVCFRLPIYYEIGLSLECCWVQRDVLFSASA